MFVALGAVRKNPGLSSTSIVSLLQEKGDNALRKESQDVIVHFAEGNRVKRKKEHAQEKKDQNQRHHSHRPFSLGQTQTYAIEKKWRVQSLFTFTFYVYLLSFTSKERHGFAVVLLCPHISEIVIYLFFCSREDP